MTKRSLYIIIAILLVMDMAAGFWYLAGHFNSDGHGMELFSGEDQVTDADTLGGDTQPDRYHTIDLFRYYVSTKPAVAGNALSYYSCVKRFKGRIPTNVNGSNDLSDLLSELNHLAFGNRDNAIENSANAFLAKPTFTTNAAVGYKRLSSQPEVREGYGYVESVKIYPAFASSNFLVMAVDRQLYDGHAKSEQLQFVTYTRTAHHLMGFNQMFDQSRHEALLQAINRRIAYRNREGGHNFRKAQSLCQNLMIRRNGITFVYAPQQLASDAVQVFVPYKDLKPAFTSEMASLVATDSAGHDFDPITFKHK